MHVQALAEEGVDDVLVVSTLVQGELLVVRLQLICSINSGSVMRSLHGQILVIFPGLVVIERPLLLKSELLVLTSITVPEDEAALVISVLGHIEDLTLSMD